MHRAVEAIEAKLKEREGIICQRWQICNLTAKLEKTEETTKIMKGTKK